MKRGDVVISVGRGDSSGRPRPALVVQADAFNAYHPAVTVAPITSLLTQDPFYRVFVAPDDRNGLRVESEVEVDLLQAVRRTRVARVAGRVSDEVMFNVDQALRRWLAL